MVGVAILGIVFTTFYSAMKQGFFLIEQARDNTRATQILHDEMENLRMMSWDQVSYLPASGDFTPYSGALGNYIDRYTCERTVGDRKTDQKMVTLTLNWSDSRGRSHSQRYVTLISRDGLNKLINSR